jgi:flagellar motor switch protein FliG
MHGSVDRLTRLATRAFGEIRANELFTAGPAKTDVLKAGLGRADPDGLATALAEEHPQVAAVVLAGLGPAQGARIFKRLPGALQQQAIDRVARLTEMPPTALADIEAALGAGLPVVSEDGGNIDGVRTAAVLLNQLPPKDAESVLDELNKSAETTATAIRHAMFTFEDLARLDRRGWQTLLKEIDRDQLLPALKTAGPEVREKVMSSLSKRAAQMLNDDLDVLAPIRLADVEKARQAVVDVALRLRSEGRLAVAGQGADELV